MTTYAELSDAFSRHLSLDVAPVAIAFLPGPPAGVAAFAGGAPSGCSFWRRAAELPAGASAFATAPADHHGCPIGSYTHRIDLPAGRAVELGDTLGVMAGLGYLSLDEVPGIPRLAETPGAVVYSRLADAPAAPDVVVFAVKPGAAMLLGEAVIAAKLPRTNGPLARPTCMALPAAVAGGATQSLGCVGNRVYTGLSDAHLYEVVRGRDLGALAAALATVASANGALRGHHEGRKRALTVVA
ncbi:MAG: hypothetical protein JWM10_45 [Myxococcaceae bacterium]|nr:hypothetical protein [Myxococcaceae bacterium]